MEESSRRQDSLLNQHEGRCSIRVRWLWEGWKDPTNNEWLHTYSIITGGPNEFAAADPYPDADNSAGRASRCLVIREAGKEILVPFPAERMKAWPGQSSCKQSKE